jgi:hypothetical protein
VPAALAGTSWHILPILWEELLANKRVIAKSFEMGNEIKKLIACTFLFCLNSCYLIDSAGYLKVLGFQINSPLRSTLLHAYFDSLIEKRGFRVPVKWKYEIKQSDLDTVDNVRLYFKEDNGNPEEMYLISFNGMLLLNDVYRKDHWVAVREDMSKKETDRVIYRFQTQILDTIEAMAKKNGLPDSLIYYNPKIH